LICAVMALSLPEAMNSSREARTGMEKNLRKLALWQALRRWPRKDRKAIFLVQFCNGTICGVSNKPLRCAT
jgi:hypothetical protein